MTDWTILRAFLPVEWMEELLTLSPAITERVQEIRLRAEEPIRLSLPTESCLLGEPPIVCSCRQLEECFLRFCQHAVYAHEWELSQGFLAVKGGIRVGVAGTAILDGNCVRAVRDVTSLCIRLPRRMPGCAAPLQGIVTASGCPVSTLLVGSPSAGKTTLLRDLAVGLARRFRVTVVDERGELAGVEGLSGCDVLKGYPKAVGLRQAVRCLAPEVVLFDELGTAEEIEAVSACAHAGVAVVATFHGRSPKELERQPLVRQLIARRSFLNWVFLMGRQAPGRIKACYQPEVKGDAVCWIPADCIGRDGDGLLSGASSSWAGGVFAPNGTAVGNLGSATGVYALPDGRTVGAADCLAWIF